MEELAEYGKGGTNVEEGFAQDRGQREAAGCYTSSRRHIAEGAILQDYNRFRELHDTYRSMATNSVKALLGISDVVLKSVVLNG
jgi:hypothetical protein